jgi:hypothetical protein
MEKPVAEFTEFTNKSNWVNGKVGKYNFEAKLFDVGSGFGIDDGRVSKLAIYDELKRIKLHDYNASCILIYDRGWGKKPNKKTKPYFDAVMELLENSPKRFENENKN